MTDKEKLDKLVAEIERRKKMNILNENKYEEDIDLLSFYNSMQEEPKDKCKGCNNVKGCITCVDGLEWAHIEEPKECIYSKDNYTDEDRKVLCDGCEEECIEKMNEERKRDLSLWSLGDFENNFFEIIKPYKDSRNYKNLCIRLVVWRSELWRWIHWKKRKEEPVSEQNLSNVGRTGKNWKESVSEAAEDYSKSTLVGSPYIKKNAFKAGANWQLNKIRKKYEENRD